MTAIAEAPAAKPPDHNRTGIDYRKPMPRPPVKGIVIDFHVHLHARRHGPAWFAAARHYGIDAYVSMTPLEEALGLQRDYPGRIHFIVIPNWRETDGDLIDGWLRRLEAFYNIGSRIAKFWSAPPAIGERGWRIDSPRFVPLFREIAARGMGIMTHIGDPEIWYRTKYADSAKYGTRQEHYRILENVLGEYRVPWAGAHLCGHPEDLHHLQDLLDRHPNLSMDCSATRWMVREISARRDEAREFFIRNQDRLIFGTDQVSSDQRGFDFQASRIWCHRKMWETAYVGTTPIFDPDLPEDRQPTLRGLALPTQVLQKLYHDNAVRFLEMVGAEPFRAADSEPGI